MKKLSKVQTQVVAMGAVTRGRLEHPFITKLGTEVSKLKVGEALQLTAEEWQLSVPPSGTPIATWLKKHKVGMRIQFKRLSKGKDFIFVRTS